LLTSSILQNKNVFYKKNKTNCVSSLYCVLTKKDNCDIFLNKLNLFLIIKAKLKYYENVIDKNNIGLYHDDGLSVVNLPGPDIERLRQKVIKIFQSLNLSVTIECNLKATDFLDVYLNLATGIHRPFRKENCIPQYVHNESNHPRCIKAEIPKMISKRLSALSQSKEIFDDIIQPYQDAVMQSGYSDILSHCEPSIPPDVRRKRTRTRAPIWFNPPFSITVRTNIGRKFLALIDKHFGRTRFAKNFNRNTVKISYSCMPNIEALISGHNRKILSEYRARTTGVVVPCPGIPVNAADVVPPPKPGCNCRAGVVSCPLNGQCQTKSLIYNAKVIEENKSSDYIGLASNTFKQRWYNHTSDFRHRGNPGTKLSKYIWKLKDADKPYEIKWSKLAQAPAYHPASRKCHLCLTEKTMILMSNHEHLLNARTELVNTACIHRLRHLLSDAIT